MLAVTLSILPIIIRAKSPRPGLASGEWMKARGNRYEMVIATKYTTNFRDWKLGKNVKSVNYAGNNMKSIPQGVSRKAADRVH
jgi:aryl-alcohol dehydrogenase-like predicted oxidoreductase